MRNTLLYTAWPSCKRKPLRFANDEELTIATKAIVKAREQVEDTHEDIRDKYLAALNNAFKEQFGDCSLDLNDNHITVIIDSKDKEGLYPMFFVLI